MHLPKCLCMSVLLMIADGFVVQSPSDPLVVPLGGSVVLPCSVDMLLPVEDLEVQWKRDSESLVHLFQDGESRPEAQHQDYHDRAHFFTEEIQHGNFSLLLSNVRAEDKGEYRCKVYSDHDSGENVVEIKYVERLIVSGSNHSISPYEGEDLTLSCSVDSHIPPEEIEEVSWKRTDKNGEIVVLLFQYNEIIIPDQYKDRAEFFADEIPKANFSLRLKSFRAEDKGVYTCLVFAGDFSAKTTVDVKISLSTLHIVVLLLCGLSFGSASLLGCLVCYKFHSVDFHSLSGLRWSFHLLPNLLMVTAFIIWGFIDGALNEVISCSTLNLLRPLLLIVTVPQKLTDSWNQAPSIGINHAIFSVVFYSVLLHNALERRTFYSQNVLGIIIPMLILALLWISAICFGGCMTQEKRYTQWAHALLIQLSNILTICLVYYSFGQSHEETLILPLTVGVVVIFLMIARACKCYCIESHKFCWSMLILIFVLLESGVIVYYHYSVLEHEKDRLEWTCVAAFVQTLTMMVSFKWDENELEDLSRLVVYMVGAVGLIFLNSFALGTQLILNARNSEIIQKDLRAIIFPAEGAFVLSWLAYLTFSYSHLDVSCFQVTACKERKALNCCKKPHNKHRSNQKDAQDPPATHELETCI